MMRAPVTVDEMRVCIERLHLAMPRRELNEDTLPQIVRIYREALESFDGECVKGSVSFMLKTIEKFPTPNAWVEHCRTWLKHNRPVLERAPELDSDGNDIACRVCRAVPRWARLRMTPTPFSLPMAAPTVWNGDPLPAGECVRRIVVCDRERHRSPLDLLATMPENFIAWES